MDVMQDMLKVPLHIFLFCCIYFAIMYADAKKMDKQMKNNKKKIGKEIKMHEL